MKLIKIATIGTLAISIAGLSACNNMMPAKTAAMKAPTQSQPMANMNVVQIAQSNADFSLLAEAVVAADLADALSDTSASYTVLAPTNAAFVKVLQETGMTKAELFANKPLLTKILTYHVIKGNTPVYQKHVRPGNYTMFSTDTLMITPQGRLKDENGRLTNILKTDIAASNGVVHVIDRVLLPK
ncbi:fasciclin domain-containing protein [Psychrobacter sp. FME5]|uniref:fasciclin domain-containing protein n=1 Tax=Psychrobacter sp. FME5 TaxID=2487706 RepID=UPI0017879A54|nr:fasciclin domain-containing protein [Psychrobacter sp. FME5]MBE0445605.1 fasciclin domain-containing protein [Psychrobacter sp. FME5]